MNEIEMEPRRLSMEASFTGTAVVPGRSDATGYGVAINGQQNCLRW
jgi:hypothetical protein